MYNTLMKINGVNLGAWLCLEKWMTPSLFNNTQCVDEYSLCNSLNIDKLTNHYETFITEQDIVNIKKFGLNSVRIPITHGVFGNEHPYIKTEKYIDNIVKICENLGISVLIDLHTAPGSQNGWAHSGKEGELNWDKNDKFVKKTIEILTLLAKKYKSNSAIFGIELLNEPSWDVNLDILKNFYTNAYASMRAIGYKKAIVMHDSFRLDKLTNFFIQAKFKNTYIDRHLYQCFGDKHKSMNIDQHINEVKNKAKEIAKFSKILPIIVGEWSLGLDEKSLVGLNESQRKNAFIEYYKAQNIAYSTSTGWYYWSYKLESNNNWNFKHVYESYIKK